LPGERAPRHALLIDASSLGLRRTLGPTAWVVFEELLLSATHDEDGSIASVSVRSLAGSLGLAKDTVARSLGRIRATGLVSGEQTRADTGVFAAGSYRIVVPDSVRMVMSSPASLSSRSPTSSAPPSPASLRSAAAPRVARRSAPSPRRAVADQLSLVLEA
jgi:hypothetical protein